jgi:predicted metal-dependent phosphoesterase TrpH
MEHGEIEKPVSEGLTNNHVHTTYSFSPYSPSMAVWKAVESGLSTVGLMDHDSVGGADEFIAAGKTIGIATTIGFEMRTDWNGTPLAWPQDQQPGSDLLGVYHGVRLPHTRITAAEEFLAPAARRAQRAEPAHDRSAQRDHPAF